MENLVARARPSGPETEGRREGPRVKTGMLCASWGPIFLGTPRNPDNHQRSRTLDRHFNNEKKPLRRTDPPVRGTDGPVRGPDPPCMRELGLLQGNFWVKKWVIFGIWHCKNKESVLKVLEAKLHIPSPCLDTPKKRWSTGIYCIKRGSNWL